MRTFGAGKLIGCHTCVLGEEPPEMPRRDPEAGAELRLGAAVERAVDDEAHGSTDELRADVAQRGRAAVRAAAEAGPVAGGFGGRGQRERADVVGSRPAPTAGHAVDAGGDDGRIRAHHLNQ